MNTKVSIQNLTCFRAWLFPTHVLHLGLQIINLMNTNNQPNDEKKSLFPCSPFKLNYVILEFLYYVWYNQMHLMNIAKHKSKHCLSMKQNWSQFTIYCIPYSFKMKL